MGQRNVQMPKLTLRASFEPATVDAESRTVEITWTTGARVKRGGWFTEPYFEELSLNPKHVRMERLNSGAAPLLNSHRSWDLSDVIGVVERASLDKNGGTATVRFDRGKAGEEAFRMVREGILRNVSVGYQVHKLVKTEESSAELPVYRAEDWEPYELSMVPMGADAGAGVRSEREITNACVVIDQERDMKKRSKNSTAKATNKNEAEDETKDETEGEEDEEDEEREAGEDDEGGDDDAGDDEEESRKKARSPEQVERTRILGIQRVGRALKRPESEIDNAVRNGTSLAKFRARAQDAWAEETMIHVDKRDPRISAGDDATDKFMRCAEHLIFQRAGVADMISQHAQSRGEKLVIDPGECRGLTMAELAREFLERAGVKTRGMDRLEMVGKAFMQRGGMNSTGDFTVLLENALHKTLLAAYATTPDTWRRFCKVGTVTDFRPHPRYRQGSFGVLDTVGEGGEFKNASIPDAEKEAISAATKGRIVALTRQAIINDDMGAFSDIATRLGRAAALTIEVDVYKLLAANPTMGDGVALFHANHGNIGAPAALSVASIDADRVMMGSQQDPSKNEILELRPSILLVPLALGGEARVINEAQYDPDTANKLQRPNKVRGLYSDVVDTARLTGTTRYSFADPSIAPVIEVVFLNGQQTPFMEMQQGWRVDGTEWKIRLDFGVGAVDWRGVVRNAGG